MKLSQKLEAAREEFLANSQTSGSGDRSGNCRSHLDICPDLDRYGVYPELPEEYQQVGREYFARNPGSEVWVLFGDLPDTTREALWQRHRANLAFPAGLPGFDLHHAEQQSRECQFEPTAVNEEPGR